MYSLVFVITIGDFELLLSTSIELLNKLQALQQATILIHPANQLVPTIVANRRAVNRMLSSPMITLQRSCQVGLHLDALKAEDQRDGSRPRS